MCSRKEKKTISTLKVVCDFKGFDTHVELASLNLSVFRCFAPAISNQIYSLRFRTVDQPQSSADWLQHFSLSPKEKVITFIKKTKAYYNSYLVKVQSNIMLGFCQKAASKTKVSKQI